MTNYTKDAIDFAFENKLSDMQSAIQDAIKSKISSALADKKIEVAQSMFGEQVLESYDDEDDDVARADRELARMKAKPIKAARGVDPEKDMTKLAKKTKEPDEVDEELKGSQHKLDKNKNGKVDSHDFKLLRKESEELEEKLSVSDGIETWISDFVHSDDPRFEGKSKKERIKMAQGAYYAAKRANEAAEQIDESYTVSPENKSYDDDGEESVWHVVSHKGNTIGTIGTNFPKHQEKHGKWDFEDQAGNSRKKNEPMLNSKKEALNAFINRHKSMLNQSKKGTNEAAEELDELSVPNYCGHCPKHFPNFYHWVQCER